MLIPGRHEASGSYRYGFQGQEKDDEIKGEGNSLNYTFRMHDPRVGRFFAVDPLSAKYPWYTPYSFSGNSVIAFIELEGLEQYFAVENGVVYHPSVSEIHNPNTKIFFKLEDAESVASQQREYFIMMSEAEKNTLQFPGRFDGINDQISINLMEMFRRNDETELAFTVFPTINENFSAENSISLVGQELMDEELFALDIALEKKEDETTRKKNIILYSEEFIIEDRSENVLFLESSNKTVKRIVVAQLASETKPRIFEVVERTEMTQIFNYIIESREVVVNGEKYIYQYRQGAEASLEIGEKVVEFEANVDFKAKLDYKDTELIK